eukprot:gnl/Trimastix_PCT/1650.p1 GENE.gnl/Trimastix_PCT/1650~~gnl/Trimastix_PCT/1650.p1  ORF type:complete len:386 (+),score=55.61 gnl/Trimastix_PCT/1650:51-1208(+)
MDSGVIAQFIAVTDSTLEHAHAYLEMAGGNLERAISLYFEQPPTGPVSAASATPQTAPMPSAPTSPPMPEAFRAAAAGSNSRSRISTFSDMRRDLDASRSAGPKRPEYTSMGGQSAQKLIAPRDRPEDDAVAQLFSSAQRSSTGQHADDEPEERKPDYFAGSGCTLGTRGKPSVSIDSRAPPAAPKAQSHTLKITFWRQGFQVNDSPLFDTDDPKNMKMVEELQSGYVPPEVIRAAGLEPSRDARYSVQLVDHRYERYEPPPPPPVDVFTQAGYSLGRSAATPAAAPAPAPSATPASPPSSIPTPPGGVTVQVRLVTGQQTPVGMPATATVHDLIEVVRTRLTPGVPSFELFTPSPRRVVSLPPHVSQTLAELKLDNSVLVQRAK